MDQLPVPSPSWSIVGELRPSLVRRFRLPQTIPVVAGASDSIACAFGAGITAPGPVSEMAGSSTCLNTVVSEPTADLAITHYPSAVGPDGYVTEVGINTAGEAVDWLASLTYGGRSGRLGADDFELLDREAGAVPPGSDGLLFIPVLGDGERDDPSLRGAMLGLSVRHDRRTLARAALEGVAFAIRAHVDDLSRASTPATEMRVSGRPASLRTWNHIKADVLGIPVTRIPGDATTSGVAMLAGIGVGIYPDADTAVATACRSEAAIEPDPANHDRYTALFERYRAAVASATLHAGAASTQRAAGAGA
jgi:xylulokinase